MAQKAQPESLREPTSVRRIVTPLSFGWLHLSLTQVRPRNLLHWNPEKRTATLWGPHCGGPPEGATGARSRGNSKRLLWCS